MGLYDAFGTSTKSETEGVVLEIETSRITIARAGGFNKAYTKALDAKLRPHRRIIRAELMSEERALEFVREAFVETVVLNWETKKDDSWTQGIEGSNGELLPFTKENVLATLTALPDLFLYLREQADSPVLFRAALRAQAEGN